MKIFGKEIDNKIIVITILSIFLLLETGVMFYGKNSYSNTIATLTALSAQLHADNDNFNGRLESINGQVLTLKNTNTELEKLLSDTRANNNDLADGLASLTTENRRITANSKQLAEQNRQLTDRLGKLTTENRRIIRKLTDIAGLASTITSTSGDAEATIDAIIEIIGRLKSIIGL